MQFTPIKPCFPRPRVQRSIKTVELDQKLSGEIAGVKKGLAKLDRKMAVMQWMLGATLTGVAVIIVKIFFAA